MAFSILSHNPRSPRLSLAVLFCTAVACSDGETDGSPQDGDGDGDGDASTVSGGSTSGGSSADANESGTGSGGATGSGGDFIPFGTGGTDSGSGGADTGGGATGGADTGGSATGGTASGGSSTGGSSTGGQTSTPVSWPLINGVQWADNDGNAIQAHGGGMLKIGGSYYWFGENRNPDNSFHAVSLYRSTDLHRWEHAADVLTSASDPELDGTNVERPKIVENESTSTYVMWMHWENGIHYGEARAAVASSPTIDGDYTYHGSFRPLQDTGVMDHDRPGYMSRDCTLFVDDDGTAYFLSAANENYDLHLYRLTDDYLSIDEHVAVLFEGQHREAPALFKRGDRYFLITSGSTGWDPNQAQYATSTSLTEGWSSLSPIGNSTTFYSQSTFVLTVEGATTEYLYMGDRWAGAWGGRVNESSYLWQELTFPSDTTAEMRWDNVIAFDTTAGAVTGKVSHFSLLNVGSGLVLGIEDESTADGGDAVLAPSGASSQEWKFDYDAAGHFQLINQNSQKVLDVPDESTAPGVALHQWEDLDGDHQTWLIVDRGDGYFQISNKNSGLVISVTGASTEAGATVEQAADTGGDEQLWRIVALD